MNEEMMVMEETTAVAVVDDAEVTELAEVNGVEVGEGVEETETNGVNPVVAAGIGLGVTGIVGGLTYLFLKKKRKNKAQTNGETKKVKEDSANKKPATEAELEEYLRKLADEMKAANEELIKIKKNNEETEEKEGNEE